MKKSLLPVLSILMLAACGSEVERTTRLEHTDNGSYDAVLSRHGEWAVVSTSTGITLWDVEKHLPKYVWHHNPDMPNDVFSVALSDDNRFAVTGNDHEIALWNTATGSNVGFWQVSESSIEEIGVSNQGRHLILALQDGKLEHFNLDTGRRLQFLGHTDRISAIAMSANGRYVLSGSYDGQALFWDSKTGQVVHKFAHQGRVTQVALHHDGKYAFSANSTKESIIWDLKTGQEISRLNYPTRFLIFTCVVFSDDGSLLATGAPNHKIKLWDVKTGEKITEWSYEADTFSATMLDIAFSPDNRTLIGENSFGIAEKWDISKYKALTQ